MIWVYVLLAICILCVCYVIFSLGRVMEICIMLKEIDEKLDDLLLHK